MKYRLENHTAKKSEEIKHSIRITYKLYSLRPDGSILNCYGTNESLDRLLSRHKGWIHKGNKYIIRKAIIETHEEPVFKVITVRPKLNSKGRRTRAK